MTESPEPCTDLGEHSGKSQQRWQGPDEHELVQTKPSKKARVEDGS